jgi:hypothetical protein
MRLQSMPSLFHQNFKGLVILSKNEGAQATEIAQAHYYPQEGHGFAKRENQIDALKRTVDWFEKYMKAVPSGTSGQ